MRAWMASAASLRCLFHLCRTATEVTARRDFLLRSVEPLRARGFSQFIVSRRGAPIRPYCFVRLQQRLRVRDGHAVLDHVARRESEALHTLQGLTCSGG